MSCRVVLLAFLLACAGACDDAFEFSPNQVFDSDSSNNLNEQNLKKLFNTPADDTITIAFIGDSQRFYDELERFIHKVNSIPSVDLVLLAGDITDFGLLEEFEQVQERLSKLDKPYIGIVGNHDLMAKGEETFEHIFGPLNFSFVYDSVKFIIHNTNGREYEPGLVPDMQWLRNQFTDEASIQAYIPVSHIPPFSADFDKTLEPDYVSLFDDKNVLISLHGHTHEFMDGYPYNDGVEYMTSHSFDLQSFVLMKIVSGKMTYTVIEY